ncbi:MAG: penicillin-binding protein 1B, partial [Methyloprofundus sp.]|nr:penicillin-binding protein 1B [Methyloprofundus sp.]
MAVAKKTSKVSKPRKRKPKAKPKQSWLKRLWRHIKKPVLVSVATLAFVFICYLGYLDYTVRKQFEGKRWAIPARVYASPVEIYAGLSMNVGQLASLLQELHYRPDRKLSSQATYDKKARHITLKTREFTFWDKTEQVQHLRVAFSGTEVRKITDMQTQRELAIVRLEPVQIGSFYPAHKEDRVLVRLDEVPKTLVQGLLATEDRDFYQHIGISFKGIARAMWVNLKAGGFVQGGSTITQQLVKNFYLTSERSLRRKINEALMALILELRFSKDEILEAYLNEVYLGQDGAHAIHGFGLASEFYFSRPLNKLPLHQV